MELGAPWNGEGKRRPELGFWAAVRGREKQREEERTEDREEGERAPGVLILSPREHRRRESPGWDRRQAQRQAAACLHEEDDDGRRWAGLWWASAGREEEERWARFGPGEKEPLFFQKSFIFVLQIYFAVFETI
jgi:hypothetical protein